MIIRSDTTHECDRQMDGQTHRQTQHDGIDCSYAEHSKAKISTIFGSDRKDIWIIIIVGFVSTYKDDQQTLQC